jgi:hypothetical protein
MNAHDNRVEWPGRVGKRPASGSVQGMAASGPGRLGLVLAF